MAWFIAKCRDCGISGVYLSHKHICITCSKKRACKAACQIMKKKGRFYQNYKKSMLKYLNVEK